jgi:pyrroloquinoline-quinone synthase
MSVDQLIARADATLDRFGFRDNPYLLALRAGTMSLAQFRQTQEQFFFAVSFFPRPMAALVGRIPTPAARMDILRNLVEEHGAFQAEHFHHSTFLQFLGTIGSAVTNFDEVPISPALRAFNSVLTCSCVLDELEVGVCCMGIIEHAFAGISASIGQSVVANGWVREEDLVHYKLHAEIDGRHAAEFYAVVADAWEKPARRYYCEQGLELGAYIFDRLYRDLLVEAQR